MRQNLFLLALTILLISGCGPGKIKDTEILDTPDNQSILELVERYRKALENLRPNEILILVSKEYHEDAGNNKVDDDYGFEGLGKILMERLSHIRALRYFIRVSDIRVNGQYAEVDYSFRSNFQLRIDGQDTWHTKNDVNRLMLIKEPDGWKFTGGL